MEEQNSRRSYSEENLKYPLHIYICVRKEKVLIG
jgi:hypothetical protein